MEAKYGTGPPPGAIELRLSIDPGEPLRGRLMGAADMHFGAEFHGWIELMALINDARELGPSSLRAPGR
jgi:hypothetical protein